MIGIIAFVVGVAVVIGICLEIEYQWIKYKWREGSYDYEKKRRMKK